MWKSLALHISCITIQYFTPRFIQNTIHSRLHALTVYVIPAIAGRAPRGFGDLGRMAIYFQGAGGTGNYFQGFGEQAHSFGDLGSPAK